MSDGKFFRSRFKHFESKRNVSSKAETRWEAEIKKIDFPSTVASIAR